MAAPPPTAQNINDWLDPHISGKVNDQKSGDPPPTLVCDYPNARIALDILQNAIGGTAEGNVDHTMNAVNLARVTLAIGGGQKLHLHDACGWGPGLGWRVPERLWVKLEIEDVQGAVDKLGAEAKSTEIRILPGNKMAARVVDSFGFWWIFTSPEEASTS